MSKTIRIEILTTPDCVHCADAKRLIDKVKTDMPDLEVDTIDVAEHPEVAQKYMLMSAPGIVINGKLEFMGVPSEEELMRKIGEHQKNK